ncbi:MAG: energy transducer TonB [Chromatiaceae bacterium]|nr:energy transducer TonB [Chromatiaceae bacterium]
MEIKPRHWLVALSGATLAHLTLVAAMQFEPQPPRPTPVVISLGAAGAAPGGAGEDGSAPEEEAATSASASASEPPAATPSPEPNSAPEPESTPEPIPEPPKTPPAQVIKPPPKPAPKPEPPKPREKPPVQPQAPRSSAPEKAASKPPRSSAPAASVAEGTGAQGKGQGSGSGSGSGGRGMGKSGSGSGSNPSAKGAANYHGQLVAWLNRHKRYPTRAQRLRQEGTVVVRFTIDKSGQVLSHQIVTSSGHPLLDQEVQALLGRASPLPAMPAALSQSRLTLTVPIRFNLR